MHFSNFQFYLTRTLPFIPLSPLEPHGVSFLRIQNKRSDSSRIICSLCTVITMDSCKKWQLIEEQERLRLRKEEWYIQQKLEKEHEERKSRMIEEYERKRAELMKNSDKQKSLQRSKSSDPQRRETNFSSYEHSKEREISVTINDPEGIIIDKKELHKIKISIYKESSLPTKDQTTLKKIERDIIDPDDIILPRRQNEGTYSIFKCIEIEKPEEKRNITFSQDEQLEKELSTSRKNTSTNRRNLDDDIIHYCDSSSYKSTTYRNKRIDDERYHRNRRRNSSIRDSEEKDRSRNERRNRSSSRHSSHSSSFTRDQSRSRYRSRSHSPTSGQTKERRRDNESKFSSRRNYLDHSRDLDNHASSKSFTSSLSNSFYNSYIRLPRPMLMPMPMPVPRVQAPSIVMPVFPGVFPAPFPPINIYRWQQPHPRFINGKGIRIHNNRYNAQRHI